MRGQTTPSGITPSGISKRIGRATFCFSDWMWRKLAICRACLVQTLEQTCLIKTLPVPCLWHVWLVSWVRDWARHPLVTQADKIGRQALAWRLPGVINAKADMPATQITAHCLLSLILLFCPASISLFNKKKIKWPYPFDVKLFIWTYQ